jgi:lipoprotein NlpD
MQDKKIGHLLRIFAISLLLTLVSGCTANRPAPVIERGTAPTAKTAKTPAAATEKDWRPGSYTVKRGDTLYSIGLEYGYDYKEIAQANRIQPPYTIYVGQQLRLPSTATPSAANSSSDGEVVIRPLNNSGSIITTTPSSNQPAPTTATTPSPATVPGPTTVISEPKALKEPYSAQALATPPTPPVTTTAPAPGTPVPAQSALTPQKTTPEVAPGATASPDTGSSPTAAKPAAATGDDESINWGWPATGKVIAGFSDTANGRGIDIAGTQGQAVVAAAPGKVIYSGSDLRGYGKLVIIKHNNTYLSVYAHNSQILVKEGQQVNKGQKIAEMGSTDTDKIKLHFEIRRQGKSVDPASYLPSSGN